MSRKKLKIGINGFGRIGRAIFRINYLKKYFDVVVINDINPDNHNIAYLLKYDTTYGRFTGKVDDDQNSILVDKDKIDIHHQETISNVPWEKYEVDLVIEASGVKNNLAHMEELKSRVPNVILTYSPENVDQTIVFGVNEDEIDIKNNFTISSSICDSIALSPIVKILQQASEISHGYLITLHPWLSYQNLLDGPSKSWSQPGDVFSHYALGRTSTMNLIPKSTSAVLAAEKVLPGLTDKLDSFSYRIPTSIVSGAVLVANLKKSLSKEQITKLFEDYEKKQKIKVIKNSIEPLTSMDYAGEEYSAIIDHRWTKINKGMIKLSYWYDNEWGYSSRVVDLVKLIEKKKANEK